MFGKKNAVPVISCTRVHSPSVTAQTNGTAFLCGCMLTLLTALRHHINIAIERLRSASCLSMLDKQASIYYNE